VCLEGPFGVELLPTHLAPIRLALVHVH
jgi:hypothetical protein